VNLKNTAKNKAEKLIINWFNRITLQGAQDASSLPCMYPANYEGYFGGLQVASPSKDQGKEEFLHPCPHKMLLKRSTTFPIQIQIKKIMWNKIGHFIEVIRS
jgi:hypothetical protein